MANPNAKNAGPVKTADRYKIRTRSNVSLEFVVDAAADGNKHQIPAKRTRGMKVSRFLFLGALKATKEAMIREDMNALIEEKIKIFTRWP
jgi:hypothetical protein